MDMIVERKAQKQENFRELYEKLSDGIWVLKIDGVAKRKPCRTYLTGFTVRRDGHVMTCAHGGWHAWSDLKVKARRLDGINGFEFVAEIVSIKLKWDMCLLKVSGCSLKEDDCVKLGSGVVKAGEAVMVIGHPKEFVGSYLVGVAAYACTDNVDLCYQDFGKCSKYECEALANTPLYRVMGHIWNSDYFEEEDERDNAEGRTPRAKSDRVFEENLQPRLPIIQCCGLTGGEGTSGAPIFNADGDIIGMLVLEADGYQIGVHVMALKMFLRENLPSEGDGHQNKEISPKDDTETIKSLTIPKKRKI